MRGRKPLPRQFKVITGNRGRRPLNDKTVEFESAMLPPPKYLSAEAAEEWRRVSAMLYALGVLSAADVAVLGAYCQAFATWKEATMALQVLAKNDPVTKGLLIRTHNGTAIQNPLLGVANKAAADVVRYASEFGMTPAARARLNAPSVGTNEHSAADKYFA